MKLIKPKFWDKDYLTFQSILLYPFTFLIDIKNIITSLKKPKKYNNIKSICVGNIYLGGTGKTPLVDLIAKKLNKKFKIAIIKKNYKSHLDEKRLLEKNNKVFFDINREISITKAIKKKFEIVIFDDGLQDNKIDYDLKIVCFSSIALAGNEQIIPSGPLREGLKSLKKYDAVFVNDKSINKNFSKKIKSINPKIAIFNGEYVSKNYHKYTKNNYLTFCGIGNPISFINILKKYNIRYTSNIIYPDHYYYSEIDIREIKKRATKNNLKILTTEKDYYRIPPKFKKNINFLKVDIKLNKPKEFNKFIKKYI